MSTRLRRASRVDTAALCASTRSSYKASSSRKAGIDRPWPERSMPSACQRRLSASLFS